MSFLKKEDKVVLDTENLAVPEIRIKEKTENTKETERIEENTSDIDSKSNEDKKIKTAIDFSGAMPEIHLAHKK